MSIRGETLARRLTSRLNAVTDQRRPRLTPLPAAPAPVPVALPRAAGLPLLGALFGRLWLGLHTYRALKARVAHLEALVAILAARDEALAAHIATPAEPAAESPCAS